MLLLYVQGQSTNKKKKKKNNFYDSFKFHFRFLFHLFIENWFNILKGWLIFVMFLCLPLCIYMYISINWLSRLSEIRLSIGVLSTIVDTNVRFTILTSHSIFMLWQKREERRKKEREREKKAREERAPDTDHVVNVCCSIGSCFFLHRPWCNA